MKTIRLIVQFVVIVAAAVWLWPGHIEQRVLATDYCGAGAFGQDCTDLWHNLYDSNGDYYALWEDACWQMTGSFSESYCISTIENEFDTTDAWNACDHTSAYYLGNYAFVVYDGYTVGDVGGPDITDCCSEFGLNC